MSTRECPLLLIARYLTNMASREISYANSTSYIKIPKSQGVTGVVASLYVGENFSTVSIPMRGTTTHRGNSNMHM